MHFYACKKNESSWRETTWFKDVNTAIPHRQAKHRGAMYRKSDSDDAKAIALATLNMLDKLPDACPNDAD